MTPGRILGIGGIFFKSSDHKQLRNFYRDKLGMQGDGDCAMFQWRRDDAPDAQHTTVWSVFPNDTKYFGTGGAPFMINYIVDDLDAFLKKCADAGVRIDEKRDEYDYGRFGWIYDPEGNKIELWQPLP